MDVLEKRRERVVAQGEGEGGQGDVADVGKGATGGGNVNIGNSGPTASGIVNVGTSATFVNIGTNKGEVFLGNTGASVFTKSVNNYFGNTGLGATWIYNSLALATPITLGSAPTSSAQLGFMIQGVSVSTQTSSTANTIQSISLVPGTWIIIANATFAAGVSYALLSISTTNNSRDFFYETLMQLPTTGGPAITVTRFAVPVVTTTFYLVAQASATANLTNTYIQAMRVG